MKTDTKIAINHAVLWPPLLVLVAAIGISLVSLEKFGALLTNSYILLSDKTSWLFQLVCFGAVVLLFFLLLSRAGETRLGGPGAKPAYSTWQWFSMILCGGIGTGIVFFGVAEPMMHFSNPAPVSGVQAFTEGAAVWGLSETFLHWGLTPYALYTIFGVGIALAHYNYGYSLKVSSGFSFILGRHLSGPVSNIIDLLCVLALSGGLAVSLGTGILQIGRGLEYVFGLPATPVVWAVLTVAVAFFYTFSSYIGLDKGLKFLASQNAKIFIVMLFFVLAVGPTVFIFNLGVQSFGEYVYRFIPKSLLTIPMAGDDYVRWWDIFFWAVWLAYAPIMGLFLARISRGRTIRQFILANLAGPALFGIIWFSVFGGAGIHSEVFDKSGLAAAIGEKGLEVAIFSFFGNFPLGSILNPFFLFLIILSFVTLADPMTSAISSSCCHLPDDYSGEPPQAMKLTWGIGIGAISLVGIVFAGLDGIRMLSVLFGFPALILTIFMMISTIKGAWNPQVAWSSAARGWFPSLKPKYTDEGAPSLENEAAPVPESVPSQA